MHTLLATTGSSPQVITETLFAIDQSGQNWPDEIFLITTSFGKNKAIEGLITQGHLERLCQEIQRKPPVFNASHILVAPGADGAPVEDARSLADHEALANFIMTQVRNLTTHKENSLHASLAGGRKTMTFYIGYAMSLFGRQQDTLSHVLVSPGYENLRDFWFPTLSDAYRFLSNGSQTLDASKAEVMLASIPFIRHRSNLPQIILQHENKNIESVDFSRLIRLINHGENAEAIHVTIDLNERKIIVSDLDGTIRIEFAPRLLELAFYTLMARATLEDEADITRPPDTRGSSAKKDDIGLAVVFLKELMPLCGLEYGKTLSDSIQIMRDWIFRQPGYYLKENTFDSLEAGMSYSWFDTRKTELNLIFREKLPENLLRWVAPSIIWDKERRRLPMSEAPKTPKGSGYGINLKKEQISIIELTPDNHGTHRSFF